MRGPRERPAQKTGYRPAQVMQIDWGEMPTPAEDRRSLGTPHLRPGLLAALLGCGDRTLLLRHDARVVSRRSRPCLQLARRCPPRMRLRQPPLRGRPPRGRSDPPGMRFRPAARPLRLPRDRRTPATPREKGSTEGAVRHTKRGFWPASSFGLAELDRQYADRRERYALPSRHASGQLHRRRAPRGRARSAGALPPAPFDYAGRRTSRVPLDGYLKHRASFNRAPEALDPPAGRAAL